MPKVNVDLSLCQSHGECARVAPDIFELGADDVLRWEEEVAEARRAEAEEAARVCPLSAITVVEDL